MSVRVSVSVSVSVRVCVLVRASVSEPVCSCGWGYLLKGTTVPSLGLPMRSGVVNVTSELSE